MSFLSLHRHHNRHEFTIFHTATLRALPAVHQHTYKSTTRLGITPKSSNQLKKTSHKAPTTSQWRRRWSTDSPFFLHIQHLSTTMTYHFFKLSMIKILPRTTNQAKKATLKETSVRQTLFQGKREPLVRTKTL